MDILLNIYRTCWLKFAGTWAIFNPFNVRCANFKTIDSTESLSVVLWKKPTSSKQPFDSWRTLGASALSRYRKIHIGVELREIGVEFLPWFERQLASNPIRNYNVKETNIATLVATSMFSAFINIICFKKRSTTRFTTDVLSWIL